MTRRDAIRGLVAGAAAITFAGSALSWPSRRPRPGKSKRRKSKNKKKQQTPQTPQSEQTPPVNVCAGKNWCVDQDPDLWPRPTGYGKCLVGASGGNICAEILFQVQSCD